MKSTVESAHCWNVDLWEREPKQKAASVRVSIRGQAAALTLPAVQKKLRLKRCLQAQRQRVLRAAEKHSFHFAVVLAAQLYGLFYKTCFLLGFFLHLIYI